MALSIGKLSQRTGVKIETIRYYEKEGLVAEPGRSLGGHRLYGTDAVERLRFVRRARELGFSLDEVRQLLGFSDGSQRCEDVRRLAESHLADVTARIRDLRHLERALGRLTAECRRTPPDVCPIFEALNFGAPSRSCSGDGRR